MPTTVNVAKAAASLNLTDRRIMQLVQEGMPKQARGRYDLVKCLEWYVRYLQQAVEKRSVAAEDGEPINWNVEKARLTRAQALTAEMEYRRKIGELIPAHLVDDKFMTFAGNVHDRFLALPSRIAGRLENQTREQVRAKLYDGVRDLLNGLSKETADPTKDKTDGSNRNSRTGGRRRKAGKVSRTRKDAPRRRS
jgi:phage terminase Nu1 subunit (DNA packaging protein)